MLLQRGLQSRSAAQAQRRCAPVQRVAVPLVGRRALRCRGSLGMAPSPSEEASSSGSRGFSPMMGVPDAPMARGGGGAGEAERNMGSSSSLGAVMERARLEFVMPTPTAQAPKLDDGGDGGDIGKHNHNGGGGGDGDGGDDDDFFNEDGDGDGDGDGDPSRNSFFRTVVPESYDKFSLGAVFSEWMRTVADLPLIIRRAVEMGLFSSAQLVRFFSMDVRPSVVRSLSRSLPPSWARDFVGRLMADPAFMQKMILESAFATCASLWYEYRARGENFKKELDLVLINTLGMAAATASTVWLISPTRSYGSVHKFPWQQMLDQLPNCVFDVSGPLRQYSTQVRAASFFTKAAELSAVGLLTGTLTSLLSSAVVSLRRQHDPSFVPSVAVPEVARSSAGLAAFFAISANSRYQLLGGMDRFLFGHSNHLWTYLLLSGGARVAGQAVGEQHRAFCQGLPEPTQTARRRVVRRKVVKKKMVAAQPAAEPAALLDAVAPGAIIASSAAEPLFMDQLLSQPAAVASASAAHHDAADASSSSGVAAPVDAAEPLTAAAFSGAAAELRSHSLTEEHADAPLREGARELVVAGQR